MTTDHQKEMFSVTVQVTIETRRGQEDLISVDLRSWF